MSTEAELNAKIQANKELIARLHGHIQMLERRMAVVLTELKRERENPLPESAVIKPKVVLAESVLKIAPKNEGQAKATLHVAAPRYQDNDRPAVPSASGFFPEAGIVKPYSCVDQAQYDEDMLVLRAYLKAKLITQTDYDAQRDVMLHALRGGADYGYQGTNFTHSNEWLVIPSKKKGKG